MPFWRLIPTAFGQCTYGVGGDGGTAKDCYVRIQDCWSGGCHSERVNAGLFGMSGIILLELGYARMIVAEEQSCRSW